MMEVKYFTVPLDQLYLDPNNYRFIHKPDYMEVPITQITKVENQRRSLRLLLGPKEQEVQDLIDSFKSNGFLQVDQIQVRSLPGDDTKYIVIEGNRRVATLKYLKNASEQRGIDLGKLGTNIFDAIPVVINQAEKEDQHLVVMALKHIGGNKKWGEWNRAKMLDTLVNEKKMSEEEVCLRITISKYELRRTLRALYFSKQYRDSDYGDQFKQSMFPIFREAVSLTNLKEWLKWNDETYTANSAVNREFFFQLISKIPIDDDEEDGFEGHYLEPVITKRDETRKLADIVNDPQAMKILKETRNLDAALKSSLKLVEDLKDEAITRIDKELIILNELNISGSTLFSLERLSGRLHGIISRNKSLRSEVLDKNDLFYDVIDAHLSWIFIANYKCFKDLKIENLSRINLVAGVNNSGKTALLEAIYFLTKQNDFTGLLEVVRRRGKVASDSVDPKWFLEQVQTDISINGCFDNKPASVNIRCINEDSKDFDRTFYEGSIEIFSEFEGKKQESLTRLFKGEARKTIAETSKVLCPSIFSSPFFLNEPHRYTTYFFNSSRSKADKDIIGFMKEQIIPTLDDIEIRDELLRFMVDESRWAEKMDLTQYGEGMQRIYFISLLFASARNGIILIDEFENAIHTELLSEFARFIYLLSKRFNTQVFITSHSKECIDALIRNIEKPKELSITALIDTDTGIVPRKYDGMKYLKLLNAGNVDIRRAR